MYVIKFMMRTKRLMYTIALFSKKETLSAANGKQETSLDAQIFLIAFLNVYFFVSWTEIKFCSLLKIERTSAMDDLKYWDVFINSLEMYLKKPR